MKKYLLKKSKLTYLDDRDLKFFRRLLTIGGGTYLLWWYVVDALLPDAFNPAESRFGVVLCCFLIWFASYKNSWIRTRLNILAYGCAWLITLHYFYLFYKNDGDVNWIVGAFITITAISLTMITSQALLMYSLYVTVLVIAISIFDLTPLT